MNWAAKRRFLIALVVGAVFIAFLSVLFISILYEAPSCTDGIQNQGEPGIDCGGACAFLCTVDLQPPTVLFTKILVYGTDRTDVVASVENKNVAAAAKNVPYTITLYGSDRSIIQRVTGVVDLPPGSTVPVFVPGIISGRQKVASAFLDIVPASARWFSMPANARVLPTVTNISQGGTAANPRIEAILTNPSTAVMSNIRAIVLVRDVKSEVVGVSSTVIPALSAQDQATAIFTWNSPFLGTPASIEVVPIVPLP